MVFAQEAQVSGLDMHFSSAISSRNIAMHLYECLLTRDESNAPIAGGREVVVSPDGLTYTFPLRRACSSTTEEMTSADVLASSYSGRGH
jgi:peptide/nickel transport system substrate-binding protein